MTFSSLEIHICKLVHTHDKQTLLWICWQGQLEIPCSINGNKNIATSNEAIESFAKQFVSSLDTNESLYMVVNYMSRGLKTQNPYIACSQLTIQSHLWMKDLLRYHNPQKNLGLYKLLEHTSPSRKGNIQRKDKGGRGVKESIRAQRKRTKDKGKDEIQRKKKMKLIKMKWKEAPRNLTNPEMGRATS